MLEESHCPREDRILPIIGTLPENLLPTQAKIEERYGDRPLLNREILHRYYDWTLGENEIIVYVGYGYCDVKIPKTYNYFINFKEPEKNCETLATIKFALWSGQIPCEYINYGCHTFCIIKFHHGVPEALKNMPSWDAIQKGNYEYFKFGLCEKKDAELIVKAVANKIHES